ncbi:MAG: hypothetical protein J5867_04490, partial [Prevotella sp.]|nr:hypothetical protein [Prevotella sp.]
GDVFNGCDLLTEIKVDEQNQVYTSVNGLLMTKDMKTLLYIPGAKTDVVVPEGTETIYRHAVRSDNLTTITLPKSLKSIENCYSNGLTSIISKMETPATVGSYSFSYRVYDNATLYVPIGTKSIYEAADSWKNFKNIVESGDVNGDGSVSVTDVVSVINYILGNHVANFLEVAADANCDGTIAITDVVRLINIILNDDSYAKPSVMFEE